MRVRRDFIKATGAALTALTSLPALLLAQENPATSPQYPPNMKITRIGSQASVKGPDEWFTGTVRIDPLFQPGVPGGTGAASVTFEPGARTAWHTHPLGQILLITSGFGRAQSEGGPIGELRPGDIVWFPPGVRHWHGASPEVAMTHIAIQQELEGKVVEWMEKVSEAQYGK